MRGRSGSAGVPLQHQLRLFAAVAAEIRVQQIDHRPQVAPFLHVDLVQVAEVIERRAGSPQAALLFHRSRFRVSLGDDEAPQRAAVLARHFLPGRLPQMVSECDRALRAGPGKKNPPAVVRHLHVAEIRPPVALHADRRAQVDLVAPRPFRAQLPPPTQVPRLPRFQGALQPAVVRQTYVIGYALAVIDGHSYTLALSNDDLCPVPYIFRAPRLPRRVRPLENPVLPGAQAAEDLALQGFRAAKTQTGLHSRQRVRREAAAFLQCQAHFVLPVDVVRNEGHESERLGLTRVDVFSDKRLQMVDVFGIGQITALQPRQTVHGRKAAEIQRRQP